MSLLKVSTLLTLLQLASVCVSYKIVLFAPNIANSQVGWNKRVSETLAKAGHDVTVILVNTMEDADDDVKFAPEVRVVPLNASTGFRKADAEEMQKETMFGNLAMWDPRGRRHMNLFMNMLVEGCRVTVQNKKFMKWLTDEKFDIAFSHMYHTCPIALIHAAKIPTWIWLLSGQLIDNLGNLVGVPTFPSYVPPLMMESTDEMNFYERTKSFIGYNLLNLFYPWMVVNKETAIMREHWDPNFPDILDLARNCPLLMVNSNELYELPRPTLAKVVNIGGLGVEFKDAKPLKDEFKKISEVGKGMIVMSFGSVAQADWMPEAWKKALLKAFARFPDYQFVVRYAKDDLKDRLPPNVHTFRWLPQADLLGHPNTKAFISHGGYNSLQESINSGVPLITVALFGDQFKNSKIAAKHGFAVNIAKGEFSEEVVTAAIAVVLQNEKYTQNAKRLSLMVRKKPVSPAHLLVKWTEFVAEFQTLENLVPAGTKLNVIQYYSIDVIAVLSTILISVIFVVYKVLKFAFLRCFSVYKKVKSD
ncbi:hypothetical protein Q1695_007053 [Nippostrongylus brasiliensis]|nr:hypothetical protein Q1695_007053 [Nippostrongylus brasiliensis]